MPKVSEEHFEKIRSHILDSAIQVCLEKPVYLVTMRDIVLEAKMSQGGVYQYFSNIDALFASILNSNLISIEMQSDIQTLLSENYNPYIILENILNYTGILIEKTLKGKEKIFFELSALYSNEPERFSKIRNKISQISFLEVLHQSIKNFIIEKTEARQFKPRILLEDLLKFIETSISGMIQNELLMNRTNPFNRNDSNTNIKKMINTLSLSIRYLLGEETN